MSPYVTWLFLALLGATTAQNATSDQTLHQVQNPTEETPHHDTIETATRATRHEHEHEHQQHIPNEKRHERPHLKFNPLDLIPLPIEGHVAQFWLDHPDFKAIPDLPARDTEYPKWLLKTMGRIPATTPAPTPIEIDQVPLSQDSRTPQQPEVRPMDHRILESESRNSIPETLPRRNDMERSFEINNIHPRRGTVNEDLILPPEVPVQELPPNPRMQQRRPVPNNIQGQHVGTIISDYPPARNRPIYFRVPLNLGLGRIQHMKSINSRRNPNNFVILRPNRFENRPFFNTPAHMSPMQRQDFRGIPVTVSRPSMMHQPGILMLPMRNQNVPPRVRQLNFIRSHPQRMPPNREWLRSNQDRPQHPSSTRQHEILVDPRFSRESWPVQEENSRRQPTSTIRRQDFATQGRQANTLQNGSMQPNVPSSFPKRSGIGARHKRQATFDSFDPFGMGNIFSFFPSEKEESQNPFNWFPRESTANRPAKQSPANSGIYIPNANQIPVKTPPKQQITYPKDGWMAVPPSSNNPSTNTQNQNPQPNRGSSNKQLPAEFMIIRPRKQNGGTNKVPWMLSNLFGADLFPENGGNKLWPFQSQFGDNSGTNNKQPPNSNRGDDNGPRRRFHDGRGPPPNDQQFPDEESEPFQEFPPSRGPTQHSNLANNNQRPLTHLPPPVNRNNNDHGQAHPQENWRQTHHKPVQTQPPTVPHTQPASQSPAIPHLPSVPHGKWIPRKSAQTKAPVSVTTHFHQMPLPKHHHHAHHHHHDTQPPTPTVVHVNHKDGHQSHRKPIQPEIKKGKRKLSPSEVRHLLSLLPKFPKEIHKKARHGKQTVGLTLKATGNRHKRRVNDSTMESADIVHGNLTQNYPGLNSTKSPKNRSKRDIEESLAQDVVFGTYGYHSGYDYHDGLYSDLSSPLFGFTGSHNHGSGIGDLLGNMFSKKSHNLFSGNLDLPYHGHYKPHLGFGHYPHGHAAGHYHPHHHHNNYWPGFLLPEYQVPLLGGETISAIPPAVPRANPDQISYTARFRYRFGIYPGYSDYIPGTNDHEIFFYYDAKHPDRAPDALIPFRSYY